MLLSSSRANDGTLGLLKAPVATTTFSATSVCPPHVTSKRSPDFSGSVDLDPGSDRELEGTRHRPPDSRPCRPRRCAQGNPGNGPRYPWQCVVTARREQTQRIPPLPPGITDARVLVQDDERQTPLLEEMPDSETCLASADDHGSELVIDRYLLAFDPKDLPVAASPRGRDNRPSSRALSLVVSFCFMAKKSSNLSGLSLRDDCPERLGADVGEQAKRLLTHFFQCCRDASELFDHRAHLAGLAVQDFSGSHT